MPGMDPIHGSPTAAVSCSRSRLNRSVEVAIAMLATILPSLSSRGDA